MAAVNRPATYSPTGPPGPGLFGLSPVVAGTACCVVSALGYTAANVCMRRLTELKCDPTWAVCNKELVTVIVVGSWLLLRAVHGHRVLPPWPTLLLLALVGLATQLGANLGLQWALGKVGLALAIPAIFGVMLTASAAMGIAFLGERVSRRSVAAIGLLLVSLAFLSLGAGAVGESVSASSTPLVIAAAVGAACLAGALYALLTITIRHTVTGATRTSAVVMIITAMGVLSLGPLSVYRLGAQKSAQLQQSVIISPPAIEPPENVWKLGVRQVFSTPSQHIALMLAAGTFNLIAFLAITKGLELTTVVRVNVLNASQVAMAAVAGIALFNEAPNPWLIFGVMLTIVGIVLIDRPAAADRDADQHV